MSWLTSPDEEWDPPDAPQPPAPPKQEPFWGPDREAQQAYYPDDYAYSGGYPDPNVEPDKRGRGRLIALIVVGWLVVSLVVLGVLLAFNGSSRNPSGSRTSSGSSSSPAVTTPPQTSTPVGIPLPAGWTTRAADSQTDCSAHSYGQVQSFFAKTPCAGVKRVLATTTAAGRPVVVAAYVITFSSAADAQRFNALVSSDGTGNISDLLRDSSGYAGLPKRLPTAAFASRADGVTVHVAEAAYASGASSSSDANLQATAAQAVK